MENQVKKSFDEETRQENGQQKIQDAWIQGGETQSGNYEDEMNRLKTLLEAEREKFNQERQRADALEKELLDAKLKSEENQREKQESASLYQEVLAKLQDDVINLSEEVATLKEELDIERTANTHTNTKKTFYNMIKGKNTDQSTEMKKAMALLRKTSAEKEKDLQQELQKTKDLYEDLTNKHQTSVKGLVQQVESLENKIREDKEAHAAVLKMNQTLEDENEALLEQLSFLQNATRETQTRLQRELDQVKERNMEMTRRCETDVLTLHKRVSTLERELEDDQESHAELIKINKMLYAELQTENEALRQKVALIEDASVEKERCIQEELQQVKEASLEMVQKYQVDILALTEEIQTMEQEQRDEQYRHAEIEIKNGKRAKFLHAEKNMLQKELDEVKRKIFLDEVKYKEELEKSTAEIERQLERNYRLSEEIKEKDQEIAEAKAALPVKKTLFKKFRHALGLRKPERWKRREGEENM